jgi:hypothetical protein
VKHDVCTVQHPPQVILDQVEVAERKALKLASSRQVPLFERTGVVVAETIDANDFVAVGEQPVA